MNLLRYISLRNNNFTVGTILVKHMLTYIISKLCKFLFDTWEVHWLKYTFSESPKYGNDSCYSRDEETYPWAHLILTWASTFGYIKWEYFTINNQLLCGTPGMPTAPSSVYAFLTICVNILMMILFIFCLPAVWAFPLPCSFLFFSIDLT